MTIVVTGAAGLIGSHLHRHLLSKGHTVVGIDDLSGGYLDFVVTSPDFIFYNRTLGVDAISDIFEEHKPDVVYHLAAYAAEGLSPFIRCFNYKNNIVASAVMVNECIKHDCKLVFTSSMAVYGEQVPPFVETMDPRPIDPYGIAKYAVELDIAQAHGQFGLRYNIIRPHNVLGIYQNIWDRYRNVVGIFIRRVLHNEPIIVYGDGEQTRAFSDVTYYMEPFEKLLSGFDNEIFNIGADKYRSLNNVAQIVKNTAVSFGYDCTIEYGQARYEAKHAFCDHTKAKQLLDFRDETNLEASVEAMFLWAVNQPRRDTKLVPYEVENKVYSYWK